MAAAPGGACRVRVFRESPGVWRVKASCEGTDSGFEATESVWVGALADAHFHFHTQHQACDGTLTCPAELDVHDDACNALAAFLAQ